MLWVEPSLYIEGEILIFFTSDIQNYYYDKWVIRESRKKTGKDEDEKCGECMSSWFHIFIHLIRFDYQELPLDLGLISNSWPGLKRTHLPEQLTKVGWEYEVHMQHRNTRWVTRSYEHVVSLYIVSSLYTKHVVRITKKSSTRQCYFDICVHFLFLAF